MAAESPGREQGGGLGCGGDVGGGAAARVPPRPYAEMLLLLSDSLPIFKARLSTITSAQRTEQPHMGLFLAPSQN